MSENMTVEIWDATGNKKISASLPAFEAVNRIMVILVERMNLPRYSPDGQLMSYKFNHKASGRQLLDEETLDAAGGPARRYSPHPTRDHRRRRSRGMLRVDSRETGEPEGRFSRFELINWWDQKRLASARVLIVARAPLGTRSSRIFAW